MGRDTLLLASLGFAATGIVLAAYISRTLVQYGGGPAPGPFTAVVGIQGFLFLTILIILLSVAYSLPGFRWKGVAGADLVTHMVGSGVLCPLCGWTLLRPIGSPLWWFIGTVALAVGPR